MPVISTSLFLLLIFFSVYTDLKYRKIFNYITVCFAASGIVANVYLNGQEGLIFSLSGLGAGLLIFFPLFALNLLGAGDVKTLGATGAILGAKMVVFTGIYALSAAGIMSIIVLIWHRRLLGTIKAVLRAVYTFFAPGLSVELPEPKKCVQTPFAVCIAIGGIIAINFNFLECLIFKNLIK